MEEFTTDNGKIIRWKEEAFSLGLMAGNMKESTWMIRKKVKEHFIGQMEDNMTEIGKMASSMESVFTHLLQEKQSAVHGMRAKELNG